MNRKISMFVYYWYSIYSIHCSVICHSFIDVMVYIGKNIDIYKIHTSMECNSSRDW